jgi:hypothetical protein
MPDLDVLLRRVSEETAPEGLSIIGARVLKRVSGHSFDQELVRYRVGAVTLALLMGVAGGMLPQGDGNAKAPAAPFGEAADLAPSTLLATGW